MVCMQPLSVDSHSVLHIPMPHMLLSRREVQEDTVTVPATEQRKEVSVGSIRDPEILPTVLDWMIPAGKPANYSVVAHWTAIAALEAHMSATWEYWG